MKCLCVTFVYFLLNTLVFHHIFENCLYNRYNFLLSALNVALILYLIYRKIEQVIEYIPIYPSLAYSFPYY